MRASSARNQAGKALTSPVSWALLGLVISRESYGLELARRFESTYGDVLTLSGDPHVYPVLDRLASRGFIEIVPGTEVGRQPRPNYRATPLGVRAYEDWLVEQVDVHARDQELWVREFAVVSTQPDVALRVLDRFERRYLQKSGQAGVSQSISPGVRSELVEGLVAEQQRIAVGGMLSWLRRARERFESLAE